MFRCCCRRFLNLLGYVMLRISGMPKKRKLFQASLGLPGNLSDPLFFPCLFEEPSRASIQVRSSSVAHLASASRALSSVISRQRIGSPRRVSSFSLWSDISRCSMTSPSSFFWRSISPVISERLGCQAFVIGLVWRLAYQSRRSWQVTLCERGQDLKSG